METSSIGLKVMLCGALITENVLVTSVAALNCSLPGWVAVTVTLPVPVKVSTLLSKVAGPPANTKVMGKPELAEACST